VGQQIDLDRCRGELLSDGPLAPADLTLTFVEQVHAVGPWGQYFPEPLFDNCFMILDQRIVGKQHVKFSLQHELGGDVIEAIAFNINTAEWPNYRARKVHMAYKLAINYYRGRSSLQLIVQALQVIDSPIYLVENFG
jgi:single-stranded-DNA-specific exonuclease